MSWLSKSKKAEEEINTTALCKRKAYHGNRRESTLGVCFLHLNNEYLNSYLKKGFH